MASTTSADLAADILRQPSVSEWKQQTASIIKEEKTNGVDPGVLDLELLKFTDYPEETSPPEEANPPEYISPQPDHGHRIVPGPAFGAPNFRGTPKAPAAAPIPAKGVLGLPRRGASYKIGPVTGPPANAPPKGIARAPFSLVGDLVDDLLGEPEAAEPQTGEADDLDQEPMDEVLALMTQVYGRVENSYNAYFNVMEVEPTWPRLLNLQQSQATFDWETKVALEDGTVIEYPPHLKNVPKQDQVGLFEIFSKLGLLETISIIKPFLPKSIWGKILLPGYEWALGKIKAANGNIDGISKANSMQAFETFNRLNRKVGTDISRGQNLGILQDWYTDRRFADQAFTGTNPTTILNITEAEGDLLQEFIAAAQRHGFTKWYDRLRRDVQPGSLYVQDHRYFRKAFGADPNEDLVHQEEGSGNNRACAAVTLFELHDDGVLHPAAIVIDYRGTMENSVTIFNERLLPSETERADNWPWRYAKTCAQVSDWIRHEVGVHLTRAHFIEEAIIVATRRTIRMDSAIYTILSPHWYKTLSLNAAARTVLVPGVIKDLVGLKKEYLEGYMKYEYENFDWKQNYVPNDLRARGFPNTAAGLKDPKYKNYAYARNMVLLWDVIRQYVRDMLLTTYDLKTADAEIANDTDIQNWVNEIRTNARIKSFPDIKTLDDLTDALTMSIHIAAPFHTAVNYLQNFYQAFVPAKPPALNSTLPKSLEILNIYTEDDLIQALPINLERQWILAVQVPWLLSFKVASDRSLLIFASSQSKRYKGKTAKHTQQVRTISNDLFENLQKVGEEFIKNSQAMSDGAIPYQVLDPATTAVSILI